MAKVFIKTWGCTLNQSDSDIMRAVLERKGCELVSEENEADVIILNTCTVKGATESKILAELKKLIGREAKIVVAGCLAANEGRIRKVAPHAPIVGAGATEHIGKAVSAALEGRAEIFKTFGKKHSLPRIITAPIARIPIEEGCAGRCAFCQTRLARPFLMSYPAKEVVRLVEEAVAKGAKEIQLTGMDTGAYGMDIGTNLVSLLGEVLKINGDFKIRLGMINPNHAQRMRDGLLKIFKNEKMYKFLHIPVQTGSEKVCKGMKRDHTVLDFEDAVSEFRKEIPEISVATDIIVGYPGESETDYGFTLEMLEGTMPDMVNISRFTPRPGTEAKKLKQPRSEVLKKRTREAHALTRKIADENAQKFLGKRMKIRVLENGANGQMKGRAYNYRQVVVAGGKQLLGSELEVEITGTRHASLFGKIPG